MNYYVSLQQELTTEYEEKKTAYESIAAGLESNSSKLEQVCSYTQCSHSVLVGTGMFIYTAFSLSLSWNRYVHIHSVLT